MLEWVDWAYDQVRALAQADRRYCELCKENDAIGDQVDEILNRLSWGEKETLLGYMNQCIDLQYRETQLAYEFGKQVGRAQGKMTGKIE